MSSWTTNHPTVLDEKSIRQSIALACRWIIDRSLITTKDHGLPRHSFSHAARYTDWRGAFKGEYSARDQRWGFFCPLWHGGQGVKALVMAYEVLKDDEYLRAARLGADFILRYRVNDPADADYGLLLAFENASEYINSSAIMETLGGLFALSDATGDKQYAEAAVAALRWVQRKLWLPDEGLFWDEYDPDKRTRHRAPWMKKECFPQPGRPLLDDGVFLTGWKLTGDQSFKEIAVQTADRLLRDENPPGNWKAYPPAFPDTGILHPRHAYWWGRPLWMVSQATGDKRYLEACRRSAQWYVQAIRYDGGLFRDTGPDFRTPSFGHATSGAACAVILWAELTREFGDKQWIEPLRRSLSFCQSVQFTGAKDPNLQGAILEKVLPPRRHRCPPVVLARPRHILLRVGGVSGVAGRAGSPEAVAAHGGRDPPNPPRSAPAAAEPRRLTPRVAELSMVA